MSYDKQNWQTGDVITANKLNHIEDGIANGGGVLICNVTVDGSTGTLDHTWQEIHDALAVMVHFEYGENKTKIGWTIGVSIEDGVYYCDFIIGQEGDTTVISFETDNANGYPSATFS